jgi:hypothetical protein
MTRNSKQAESNSKSAESNGKSAESNGKQVEYNHKQAGCNRKQAEITQESTCQMGMWRVRAHVPDPIFRARNPSATELERLHFGGFPLVLGLGAGSTSFLSQHVVFVWRASVHSLIVHSAVQFSAVQRSAVQSVVGVI